jgi:NodT family efflux transporter outer membrane factor (OMF) lipoprotein
MGAEGKITFLAAFATAACSFAPEPFVPPTVTALPTAFEQAPVIGEEERLSWWESFEDPVLSGLVEQAIDGNLQLDEAIARLEAAYARQNIAAAALWPNLSAQLEASEFDSARNTEARAPQSGQAATQDGSRQSQSGAAGGFSNYNPFLALSYELDFWGRRRNIAAAADARAAAALGDVRTATLSVIAATMRAYFDVIALEQRLDLVRQQIGLLEERSDLSEERFRRGLIDSFELYTLEEQLRVLQAAEPQLEAAFYEAQATLATLTGRYPAEIETFLVRQGPLVVSVPTEPIPAGLPSALLVQRPDVHAAWLRLEAERRLVGAERALLFPQVTLSAAAGLQAQEATALTLDNWYTSLVGQLTAPIFTGGRIRGQINAQEAEFAAAAAAYGDTVLTAFREVETSFKGYETSIERYRRLRDELEAAQASAEAELLRVRRGVGDYVSYLDAQRNFLQARDGVVQAQRALAEARLSVYRALGGTWTEKDLGSRGQDLLAEALGEEASDGPRGRP